MARVRYFNGKVVCTTWQGIGRELGNDELRQSKAHSRFSSASQYKCLVCLAPFGQNSNSKLRPPKYEALFSGVRAQGIARNSTQWNPDPECLFDFSTSRAPTLHHFDTIHFSSSRTDRRTDTVLVTTGDSFSRFSPNCYNRRCSFGQEAESGGRFTAVGSSASCWLIKRRISASALVGAWFSRVVFLSSCKEVTLVDFDGLLQTTHG